MAFCFSYSMRIFKQVIVPWKFCLERVVFIVCALIDGLIIIIFVSVAVT